MNNNNNSTYNQNDNQPVANNSSSNNQQTQKSKNTIVKIFAIIGAFVVGIIVLVVVIISFVSANSNKLICKSDKGNITIMYNDTTIKGYSANRIRYDLDQQRQVAEKIGIDNYISQFTTWFETNTSGTCSVKEK